MPNRLCSRRFVDKQNRRSPFHFARRLRRPPSSTPSHAGLCLLPWSSFLSMCARARRVSAYFWICARSSAPSPPLLRGRRFGRVIECILNEFLTTTGRTLSNLRDIDVAVQPYAVKYLSRRGVLTVTQCFRRLIKRPRTPTKSAHTAKKSGWGWSPLRAWPESDWAICFSKNARRFFEEKRSFRINWIAKVSSFYKVRVPFQSLHE